MAQILCANGFGVLAINRQIIVLDTQESICALTVDLPGIVKPAAVATDADNGDAANDSAGEEESPRKQPAVNGVAANGILHAALSPDAERLAVTTADEKCLHLFALRLPHEVRHLWTRPLSRTSSAVRFSSDAHDVLVADKTGDCFVFACAESADPQPAGRCVLSHLSMVLGIQQTPCARFLLTCDRDEKIRCTNYPRTTCIESYCLGHTEYVAAIELLPIGSGALLSASGDKSLRVWDYQAGRQLARFDLPAPALRMAVSTDQTGRCQVAITLAGPDTAVIVVELSLDADATFELRTLGEFRLGERDSTPIEHVHAVAFDASGHVWLTAGRRSDGHVQLLRLTANADRSTYALDTLDALNAHLAERAGSLLVAYDSEAIGLLFKKKFENIHDYHERKKRRIDEKNNAKAKIIA